MIEMKNIAILNRKNKLWIQDGIFRIITSLFS